MIPSGEQTHSEGEAARSTPRKHDWDAIEKNLNDFLCAQEPLTLVEISQRLGIAKETLRQNKPAICAAISARWKDWNMDTAKRRALDLEEQVRKIARGLAQQGITPTWRKIVQEGFSSTLSWRGTRRLYAICKEARLQDQAG